MKQSNNTILSYILVTDRLSISCETAHKCVWQDLTGNRLKLDEVSGNKPLPEPMMIMCYNARTSANITLSWLQLFSVKIDLNKLSSTQHTQEIVYMVHAYLFCAGLLAVHLTSILSGYFLDTGRVSRIVPVLVQQSWRIWLNELHESVTTIISRVSCQKGPICHA